MREVGESGGKGVGGSWDVKKGGWEGRERVKVGRKNAIKRTSPNEEGEDGGFDSFAGFAPFFRLRVKPLGYDWQSSMDPKHVSIARITSKSESIAQTPSNRRPPGRRVSLHTLSTSFFLLLIPSDTFLVRVSSNRPG